MVFSRPTTTTKPRIRSKNYLMERETINILFIEDNPGDHVLLEEKLINLPYHFLIQDAYSLTEARKLLEAHQPDVIISDLNLPDCKGEKTISQLQTHFGDYPIIILSEIGDIEFLKKAASNGIMSYLTKENDFDGARILGAILQAISQFEKNANQLRSINLHLGALVEELSLAQQKQQEYLHITSHSVRAPLCTLEGLVTLLKDEHTEAIDLKQVLNYIDASMQDLKQRINESVLILEDDLINVYPLIQDQKKPIPLPDLINEAIGEVSAYNNVDCFDLKSLYEHEEVVFYPQLLRDTLFVLIQNAFQFRREEVRLSIGSELTESEGLYYLSIKDNGLGIDMGRNRDKLFMPYCKLHAKQSGRGISLFNLNKRLRRVSAELSVESTVGEGTKVTLRFPVETQINAS